MGRPDGQLCDQNFEIFAENLSCLRAASGRWGTVVRTVARLLQIISLLRLRTSGPWGWPSGRLIFYTQFLYLLYARPDHGRSTSGWLSLNCKLALRSSASRRESTSSGRLQQSSHICFWKENLNLDQTLRVVRTSRWVVRTDTSWNRSFSIQRRIRTENHIVRTDDTLVWRTSRRYDTSSGQLGTMNRWAFGRDDTSSRRLAGNRNLWRANSAESFEALLNSGIPIKKHLYI
jgi:hypothetical protein